MLRFSAWEVGFAPAHSSFPQLFDGFPAALLG
jgi:hypothetical protein